MIEKQKWKSVNTVNNGSSKPSPRWGHSNCVIGDQVVLFGGYADSIYMNDLWTFNTLSMEWTQIKTTGNIPSHRSNCSLTYDVKNNRVIMFGGGGSNKTRYNTINILDWNTKVWTEIAPAENETAPWQRTYHSAELVYPYLIVFGGEGVTDLDDLWVYNFQTNRWAQIPIQKGALKPCARRFHSSCLVGNQFFVIAGCHTKYRCLSDIYSIDLTKLIQTGSVEGMEWRERNIKGYAFLTRWGHTSSGYDGKIYIFGGRFSNDLNDLLIFDPTKDQLRALKVAPETIPKPRRRPSTCFIGSCLLMFGGFNQDYYNDLHFINVGISANKPKKLSQKSYKILNFINKQQISNISIRTVDDKEFFCHLGFIRKNFPNEENMNDYLHSIQGLKTEQELTKIMQMLYQGYGSIPEFYKHGGYLPTNEEEKQQNFLRNLEEIKEANGSPKNIFLKPNKTKTFNNFIAAISDDHYSDFLQKNRENIYKDTTIVVNNFYKLDVCSPILRWKSKFFNNILSRKYRRSEESILEITIPSNIVLFQILINFMMYNYLIVPDSMTCQSWIQLYGLADYLSIKNVKDIIVYYLETMITQASVAQIFEFSQKQKIEHLALICAQFKIKCAQNFEKEIKNKYICRALEMSKFELNQKMLVQADTMMFKKKKSSDSVETEGEKENYEVANS